MKIGKDINLTQRSYLTAATLVGNYSVIIVVGLIVNPVLLGALGPSMFGTWKICQRLLAYVAGAEHQSTQALKLTIAQLQSRPDPQEKQRTVGSALFAWAIFLPILVVAGALIAWFSPAFISDLQPGQHGLVRLTCFFLVINLALTAFKRIPEAVVAGMNQTYQTIWAKILGTLVGGTIMVVAALTSGHLVALAIAVIIDTLIKGALLMRIAVKHVEWFGIRRPNSHERRQFVGFSIWVLLSNVLTKLMLSSDIIILGIIASSVSVSMFVLSFFPVQACMDLVVICVTSGMPGLGGIVGQGDFARASATRNEMLVLVWLIAVFLGSMILVWNQSFINLWVGLDNFVGPLENLALVVLMTQLCFIRIDARIIDVTLNIKMKVLIGTVSTLFSLLLAFLFASYASSKIAGMILGLIVGRLIISFSFPLIIRKTLSIEGALLNWFDAMRKTIVTLLVYCVAFWVGASLKTATLMNMVVLVPLSAMMVFVTIYFLGLTQNQRQTIARRISQIRHKQMLATNNGRSNKA